MSIESSADAIHAIDPQWIDAVRAMSPAADVEDIQRARPLLSIFEAQCISRHLDFAARWLKAQGAGFYTIGSAGHEANAMVAHALRDGDQSFLHYRSGAFFVMRALLGGQSSAVRDILLGMVASRDERIAGGRHKVFGSRELNIPPQTSTIASHLPKAVGAAFGLERANRLRLAGNGGAKDSIVVCTFGDASANHSTAVGAIHAAAHGAYQNLPLPILFVCEDNGLGISVRSPDGWIRAAFENRAGMTYFEADGFDPERALETIEHAVDLVRTRRKPAFLRLRTVRLMGHAGSDVESAYRSPAEIRADEARDPLIGMAHALLRLGCDRHELIEQYERARTAVMDMAREALLAPRLLDRDDVMAPLAPRREISGDALPPLAEEPRKTFFGKAPPRILPEAEGPLTLGEQLNRTLGDTLLRYPESIIFGEDVAIKGGVYGVTRGLFRRAGVGRVFDTPLDETTILGLAIGAGHQGLLPIAEIQYLAYLHNAIDQLRGEASSLQFFSKGQFRNPMVVRIASYAYQKGFGGHFHNDNGVAPLRDIPGLIIASPARGDDAAAMLRACVASAALDGSVCVFLEPIALYGERDLYLEGDGIFASNYAPAELAPIGSGRVYHEDGDALTIITFGNGVRMSLRVAARLADAGIRVRVFDLRWISPMPVEEMLLHAEATGKVLIADETRKTGGVSEQIIAALVDHGYSGQIRRVTGADSFIPLGDAAYHVLLTEEEIERAARQLSGH